MRLRAAACAIGWSVVFPPLTTSLWASTTGTSKNVRVELAAEQESVQPGKPFWLGLRLEMAPGWMTYWRNPGDSGLPTRIAWTLPAGFEAAPIQWPAPEHIAHGPLASYGYTKNVLLLVEVRPPATIAGPDVTLVAKVNWLECEEACLPGKAELTLRLPVAPPRSSAKWAPLFGDARRRLPVEAKGWSATSRKDAQKVVVSFRPPAGHPAVEKARFFPEQNDRIEPAAEQKLVRAGNEYRLELTATPNAPKPFAGLKGVLITETKGGAAGAPVSLDAKASGAAP